MAEKIDVIKQKLFDCGYIYLNGYVDCESVVEIKCNECNHNFKYNYHNLTSKHKGKNKCPYCREQRNIQKRINKMLSEQNDILKKQTKLKTNKKIIVYLRDCKICGNDFITTRHQRVCCSEKCSKRNLNIHTDERRYKGITIDKDITLDKLFKRDKGICAICNGLCDIKAIKKTKKAYICGEYYPTIDHIKPISKGGKHSWNNVQLAHMICNTYKSNIF